MKKFRRDEGAIRSYVRSEFKSKLKSTFMPKVKSGFSYVGSILHKTVYYMLHILKSDDHEPLYDLDDISEGVWTKNRIATCIVNGVNAAYGLIGGFITQNYLAYRSLKFMAFAAGIDFAKMTSRSNPTPLTVCMDIVFFFCFYLALIVIQSIFYVVMKYIFQNQLDDPTEQCQVGFMYGILCIIVSSLIGILVPFNIFM